MRTISTRFLPTTNTKPTRIKATVSEGKQSVTVSYDHGMNAEQNHKAVATALMHKLGWEGRMLGGHTGTGMVFVFDTDIYTIEA